MSLRDYDFKPDYNKAEGNIATDFYIPAMKSSCEYDRVSGYFSSAIYIIAWSALQQFVDNGGHMRVICSPCISDSDKAAMEEGYSNRNNDIIKESLDREIEELFSSPFLNKPARVLACLIAENIIDVKIAVPQSQQEPDLQRLFHDKVGVFCDSLGDAVGFRGSMNETYQGLSEDGNSESIDVFPSWEDERDAARVKRAQAYFEKLWNKAVDGTCIYDFPEALHEKLLEKSNGYDWHKLAKEIEIELSGADKWKSDKSNTKKKPRDHQYRALEAWVEKGRRGILKHATGSGKTYTAICAIRDALDRGKTVLTLVPSKELLYQWKKEIEENITDLDLNILLCGDGNNAWKQGGTLQLWTRPVRKTNKITIAIMDTAVNELFLQSVTDGEHLLLVADEVHRLGSPARRSILERIDAKERLGLSATPERFRDPDGTRAIFDYFEGIVPPPFSLEDAIKMGVLTKYYYYPLKIGLTVEEQDRWNELTKEINRLIAASGGRDIEDVLSGNNRLQFKMIERARILKQATRKIDLAVNTIKEHFQAGQRWIIYCDNQDQLTTVLTSLLREGYDAYEYHSGMKGDREETLSYFSLNGGILVSIRCLDEGVDIPETTHALILASSKNPREFIQRRGRILRLSEGKHFATLYDAIVVPQMAHEENDRSDSIIESELGRAIQFGEWAENPTCVSDLKILANEFGIDFESTKNGGFEDDEVES